MRMIWLLVLLVAALLPSSAWAGPRTITWTLPTEYDDAIPATTTTPAVPATPLPASNVIGHNIYLLGTGAAPLPATGPADPAKKWISTGSGLPSAVINIDRPTWVSVESIAIEPGGDPALGGFASMRSAPVLISPKLRAKSPASVGAPDVRATECLPIGSECPAP